jgi:hypothetical protein
MTMSAYGMQKVKYNPTAIGIVYGYMDLVSHLFGLSLWQTK